MLPPPPPAATDCEETSQLLACGAGAPIGSGLTTSRKAMDKDTESILGGCISLVLGALLVFGGIWIAAGHEAAAFNRLTTGPKVTTWDAVWLDLRVEAR